MAMNAGRRPGTPSWVVSAHVAGFALVFLGERVFSTLPWLRLLLTGAGAAAVVTATVLRWVAMSLATAQQRTVERALAWLSTGGVVAIALYLTTADPFEAKLGITAWELAARHRYESLVTVAWVVLVLGTLLPMLFAERALYPMRRSAGVEWRRVREALLAGLTIALAAVYTSLFVFVAGELDLKADFSYFHTAQPSESTRKIAASATDPLDVQAFFPQLNPVGTEVSSYLRDLARAAPAVHVETHDRLLFPDLARKANVFDDGVIVLGRGGQHESIAIGVDMNTARPKLKSLDTDFQKSLLKVLRPRRTAYFTVGHGELNDSKPTPQNARTGKGIRESLEHQNYLVRELGTTSGLATEVPDDATVVVVAGPAQPFLPEEAAALGRYVAAGGRLLLCLDPEAKIELQPLADTVGLQISRSLLANDTVYLRRRFNDSDHGNLATNRYSSHAAVSTLSRITSRPTVFVGAGFLDQKPGADPAFHADFAVRALPDTFADDNGNFLFDPGEKRQPYALAVAVTRPIPAGQKPKRNDEMRAFVIADADAVSDVLIGNEANFLLFGDAVRWLGGEESFAGTMSSPEDVRISHTKQKDLVWFYGSIFLAPGLVLASGLLYARRVRRSKKSPGQPKPPADPLRGEVAA